MKAFGEATPDFAPVYFWGCKWSNPWLRALELSSIQSDGCFIHPGHKRTVEPDSTSNCHGIQRRRTSHGGRRRKRGDGQGVTSSSCPWQQKEKKTLPVPCVTSSSCPWQQKEKQTLPVPCVTSSSCPWQQKEKQTLPVPCVTSSSCPWQQKENSKQGRAGQGQRQGQGRVGAGRPGQ